jgi:predicted MFS family arabinose efflux permease
MATMSAVSSLLIFCSLRFLLGIFEAVHYQALAKAVADWMPHPWRSRCMAMGLVGVPVSSLVGAPLLTYIIESSGWRNMFLAMGALGILWSLSWFFNFKGKTNPHLSSSEKGAPTHRKPFFSLLTTPCILVNCAIYFIFAYILFFGLFWLPGYFEKTHKVGIEHTGFLVILPWTVGAFFLLSAGWASDFLWKKTHSLRHCRTFLIDAGMILSALCFFLLARSQSTERDLILISFGLGFAFIANPIVNTLAVDLFPHSPGLSQALHSFFCSCRSGFFGSHWLSCALHGRL